MYARCVSVKLTPKGKAEFTTKLEAEIIPLLRKQKGFQDEITFIAPARNEALAVSLWDNKDSAEEPRRLKPTKLPTPPCTRSPLLSRRRKVSRYLSRARRTGPSSVRCFSHTYPNGRHEIMAVLRKY